MTPLRVFGLLLVLLAFVRPAAGDAGDLRQAMHHAQERVVKLYGGGIGRVKGYGSGVLISADGRVVTVLSSLLESDAPRVVLADGRSFPALVVARDVRRQLALLKIDAAGLPFFPIDHDSGELRPGAWVASAANPFQVADGPEAVSVSAGVFGGRAPLLARRRAQDHPFEGQVLLVDVLTATPGSAGGALVDARGRLVGLIGKEVQSLRTNTWLNYALPVEEVAAFVAAVDQGLPLDEPDNAPGEGPRVDPGLRLFDVGGRVRLPYVERVIPGSPAAAAGLRADDLLLSVNEQPLATCADYDAAIARLRPGDKLELLVKRGGEVLLLQFAQAAED